MPGNKIIQKIVCIPAEYTRMFLKMFVTLLLMISVLKLLTVMDKPQKTCIGTFVTS